MEGRGGEWVGGVNFPVCVISVYGEMGVVGG